MYNQEELIKKYGSITSCYNCGGWQVRDLTTYTDKYKETVLVLINFPYKRCIDEKCSSSTYGASDIRKFVKEARKLHDETGLTEIDCKELL